MASFILDNLRFIMVDIYHLKLDKYADLIFSINTRGSINYHNQIHETKNKVATFNGEVMKFYDLNLRQSLELTDLKDQCILLVQMREVIDLLFKDLMSVYKFNRDTLTLFYNYKHYLLFDNMNLADVQDSIKRIISEETLQKRDIEKA